jgi:hydroxymethylpyrimidine/phosphomethylpyrimidine kinase
MKNDLTYRKQGLFTAFIPETLAGETAWREIAEKTQGTGKVFTAQLPAVLAQLRKAGYTVQVAKKLTRKEIDKDMTFLLDTLTENHTITAP